MPPTATVLKALRFVAARAGATSGELAGEMWPDSPAWAKSKQMGTRGGSRGAAMFRPALGLLGKMAKAGLVMRDVRRSGSTSLWITTEKGREVLDANRDGR
jgi:hypothetical protein